MMSRRKFLWASFFPLSQRERGRERGRYGIVLPSSVTLLRFRVGARNDVKAEVLMGKLFPLSRWERVSEGQERVESSEGVK